MSLAFSIAPHAGAPLDFADLYARELAWVTKSVARMGVASADVEDVTQNVFITAFRRFDSYDASRPFRPWLLGIAFRTAQAWKRRARHQVLRVELEPEVPTPHDFAERNQVAALVRKTVASLPGERQRVLELHELEGRGLPEVARVLSLSLSTAYARLRSARRVLDARFRRELLPRE